MWKKCEGISRKKKSWYHKIAVKIYTKEEEEVVKMENQMKRIKEKRRSEVDFANRKSVKVMNQEEITSHFLRKKNLCIYESGTLPPTQSLPSHSQISITHI
jgi:hypothetical protein